MFPVNPARLRSAWKGVQAGAQGREYAWGGLRIHNFGLRAVSRVVGAIKAVRDAIATATEIPVRLIDADADLKTDLRCNAYEFESLKLILEEVFGLDCMPDDLFRTPLYRTAEALAEWCVMRSNEASWQQARQQRRA